MILSYVLDWAHLLTRWFHVVIGAAWIGASFYFVWLNNHVRPPKEEREGVGGELWAVHGGGFYHVTKYKVAPSKLPETLHWFKWEAYLTWVSGIGLLTLVYWLQPSVYMIDPGIADLAPAAAVGIGVGSLAVGWFVYDLLCKSPLARNGMAFAGTGFALMVGSAYVLSNLLAPRAAYIHVGAMMGTMMAANVFRVIIPNQKVMVDAMLRGEEPDPAMGQEAALRSLHNNYFTLPVLFIMVSNHFPFTFGHSANWAVLAALSICAAAVRHWFNLHGRGEANRWLLPAAALGMVSLAVVSHPNFGQSGVSAGGEAVPFEEVAMIVGQRCQPCHAATPTHPAFTSPPKNVIFDSPEQIVQYASKIKAQAVTSKIMPLGNLTQMTDEERETLGRWIDQGAHAH